MDNIKTPIELLNFMSNINYGYLGKDGHIYHYDSFDSNFYNMYILENSTELLNNLCGNCFDQVEFEREWFLKNKYEIKTIFEMVKLDYDNIYPTHSFLAYKDNDYWYWFENADFNNRGIHKFTTLDDLINYQYSKYVDFLKTFNISNEEIKKIVIMEFDKPKEHISFSKYLEHVTNSKSII